MKKQDLIKKIEREQKGALKECWEWHKEEIKQREMNEEMTLKDLESYLRNIKLYDFEDVVFYAGYIRGLEIAKNYVSE